jgi:hypothetical protein
MPAFRPSRDVYPREREWRRTGAETPAKLIEELEEQSR